MFGDSDFSVLNVPFNVCLSETSVVAGHVRTPLEHSRIPSHFFQSDSGSKGSNEHILGSPGSHHQQIKSRSQVNTMGSFTSRQKAETQMTTAPDEPPYMTDLADNLDDLDLDDDINTETFDGSEASDHDDDAADGWETSTVAIYDIVVSLSLSPSSLAALVSTFIPLVDNTCCE